MVTRTRRRREIERLFALREAKGLSLRELSGRSGIPLGTLSWWSHRLRTEASRRPFAEVAVVEMEDAGETAAEEPDLVLRHPSGAAVELRGHLAEKLVAGMLARIEQWS